MPGDCKLCGKCGASSMCGRCKSVFYCGKECQLKDWTNHKTKCKKIKKNMHQQKVFENPDKIDIDSSPFTLPSFDNKLIRIEPIEEKGYGMIANTNIKKGTIICKEKPMITIPKSLQMIMTNPDSVSSQNLLYVKKQYLALSPTEKNIYKSLSRKKFLHDIQQDYNNTNMKLLLIWSNNYITMPERNSSGIFPLISRVNHACLGNTHWRWMDKFGEERLIAIKDIKKDTEITASYIGDPMPFQQRKMKLKVAWNIECRCKWCVDDKMINIIQEYCDLDESVLRLGTNPFKGYQVAKKLIQYVEKYFDSNPQTMDKHCYDAAQYALGLNKWNEAAYYLEQSMKQQQIAQGYDVEFSVQKLEKINRLPPKFRNKFKKFSKKQKKKEMKEINLEQKTNRGKITSVNMKKAKGRNSTRKDKKNKKKKQKKS
eukprot:498719_1